MHVTPHQSERSTTEVIFFDDFKESELDRTRWNVRTTSEIYNNEQQAYVDTPETIYITSDGEVAEGAEGGLVIQPRYQPGFSTSRGDTFDFISGRIDTRDRFDFQYGTAAARIRLPAGAGLWPAFWLMGYGAWPEIGEIDVMECVGEADWVSAALNGPGYSGEAGLVNKYFFSTGIDATAWHTYAVEWSPDRLIFTVDDAISYRVTRPMTEFFGSWAFDNRKYLILNIALGGTYPFKTNGVHTPYYGLPEQTAALIANNQVKLMVDWVRVSHGAASHRPKRNPRKT
jgi:beta-glucanase (GH16 family)